VICRSDIRRFDGDSADTLHAAVWPRQAEGLRFVAWVVLDKATGRYSPSNRAPAFTIAWVPAERVRDESSTPAEIDAALGDVDQIPLIVEKRQLWPVAYHSDSGAPFPCVGIKGKPMILVARVEDIVPNTHGQLTFGWRIP